MGRCPFEIGAPIRLHREALLREAERERLPATVRPRRAPLGPFLARTGRLLIAVGTRLEARYASGAPVHAARGQSRRPSLT